MRSFSIFIGLVGKRMRQQKIAANAMYITLQWFMIDSVPLNEERILGKFEIFYFCQFWCHKWA